MIIVGYLTMALAWAIGVLLTMNKTGQYYAANEDFKMGASLIVLFVEGIVAIYCGGMALE